MIDVSELEVAPKDLAPEDVKVRRHPVWGLIAHLDSGCWLKVRAMRAFPLSAADGEVALLSHKGEEIGTLARLDGLDPESREAIEAEFARRYLVAKIEGITSIRAEGETLYWEVRTHRGPREFVVKASRETVLLLGAGRLLLVDIDGSRFEIPNVDALDAESRAVLDTVL